MQRVKEDEYSVLKVLDRDIDKHRWLKSHHSQQLQGCWKRLGARVKCVLVGRSQEKRRELAHPHTNKTKKR